MMETSYFAPNQQPRERRAQYIFNYLQGMIFKGHFKPGDRLPTEEELCKQFKVSRTTLREAIQMLRVSGMLSVTPGRGSYVQLPELENLTANLVFFGQYHCQNGDEFCQLQVQLLRNIVARLGGAARDTLKSLNQFVVSPQNSMEQNEELERQWYLKMAELSAFVGHKFLLNQLLLIQKNHRLHRLSDPDEVMRTIQLQMRFNTAILERDIETAQRVLKSLLSMPQNLNQVA